MKTKTIYICEICNCEYEDEHEAMACEFLDVQEPIVPVGTSMLAFAKRPKTLGVLVGMTYAPENGQHIIRKYQVRQNADARIINVSPAQARACLDGAQALVTE